MSHSAERQHLRSIFAGRHVPDWLALRAYRAALGAQMPVGVDLQLHAAITENSLGDDRDHVYARDFRRNDEGRRLVIGIGGARANRGHKRIFSADQRTVPLARFSEEGHNCVATSDCAIEHDVRIETHQLAISVAIAVARSGSSGLDVAEHGTSVAADRVVSHVLRPSLPPGSRPAPDRELPESSSVARPLHHARH